jgi:hypothetical protein
MGMYISYIQQTHYRDVSTDRKYYRVGGGNGHGGRGGAFYVII